MGKPASVPDHPSDDLRDVQPASWDNSQLLDLLGLKVPPKQMAALMSTSQQFQQAHKEAVESEVLAKILLKKGDSLSLSSTCNCINVGWTSLE